jgi:hypothetical protein
MIRPRWIARTLAWVGGYFWLPCPVCGENFAGFEAGRYGTNGQIACPKESCQAIARRDTQEATIKFIERFDPYIRGTS